MATLLPTLTVPSGPLSARGLFGDDRTLELEIGFGAGEHLAAQAARHPDRGFIGCEPFLNGVVGALQHIRDAGLTNIRLHMGDARDVLDRFPAGSLDRVFLLHPDPWPKARHAKRRFMNDAPIAQVARALRPGGSFRFATDHPLYVGHAMMVMARSSDFSWEATTANDFLDPPDDWPDTRYGRKARAMGHELWYFSYRRR